MGTEQQSPVHHTEEPLWGKGGRVPGYGRRGIPRRASRGTLRALLCNRGHGGRKKEQSRSLNCGDDGSRSGWEGQQKVRNDISGRRRQGKSAQANE